MKTLVKINRAEVNEATLLTQITILSKAYWNYTPKQINEWRVALTITPEYIKKASVYKLVLNKEIIGYYSFLNLNNKSVKLDNIFIMPNYIGKGYGQLLMQHFVKEVRSLSFKKIVLESDPNAESFYLKLGFKKVGQIETSIKDRYLPIMELELY